MAGKTVLHFSAVFLPLIDAISGESLGVLFRGLELIEKRLYPALHVTAGVELGLQHVAKHEWPTPPGCGTMERISLNSSLKKSSQME